MEQIKEWEKFWKEYRNIKVESEDDLFFQAAKTIHKKPIGQELFNELTSILVDTLALNKNDLLIELCCGNGLCTYELKDYVKEIIATDFAPHLIEAAKTYKSAPNITYCLATVFDFLKTFKQNWDVAPAKYLMNDAIMFFNLGDMKTVLSYMLEIAPSGFTFLLTGAPNDALKWNFYNTEERKQKYLEHVAANDFFNDGIGNWWKAEEMEELCRSLGLKCNIYNQPAHISNYRMNILISK